MTKEEMAALQGQAIQDYAQLLLAQIYISQQRYELAFSELKAFPGESPYEESALFLFAFASQQVNQQDIAFNLLSLLYKKERTLLLHVTNSRNDNFLLFLNQVWIVLRHTCSTVSPRRHRRRRTHPHRRTLSRSSITTLSSTTTTPRTSTRAQAHLPTPHSHHIRTRRESTAGRYHLRQVLHVLRHRHLRQANNVPCFRHPHTPLLLRPVPLALRHAHQHPQGQAHQFREALQRQAHLPLRETTRTWASQALSSRRQASAPTMPRT